MVRTVSVRVTCKLKRNNKRLGVTALKFPASSYDDVRDKLVLNLAQTRGCLLCPNWHQYQVLNLQLKYKSRSSRDLQNDWPTNVRSLSMCANIKVITPGAPEELRVRVKSYRKWPKSFYLTKPHKVRCGCDKCRELQAKSQGSRGAVLNQERGYWSPANFIEHVAGVRFGGGRQPEGVPRLSSEAYLRFVYRSREAEPWRVVLKIKDLKTEFGYRWQPRKPFPAVPAAPSA